MTNPSHSPLDGSPSATGGDPASRDHAGFNRIVDASCAVCFLAVLAAVCWAMFAARSYVLVNYSTAETKARWEAYKQAMREAAEGPRATVRRKPPRSTEPGVLLMMRDRFAVSLLGALVLSGAVLGSLLLLVRGGLRRPPDAR